MKEQGWRKVTYGTFPRAGRTVYAHCGMECSSNFRQCPKTEESDIKLAAAVNLSGVDFCLLKTAAQFGINQEREKCHVETACLKMLKLRQQKKKFICTTTMALHLSCSVIPLPSCVLHGSEVHAVILSMHTNAYRQWRLKGLFFPPSWIRSFGRLSTSRPLQVPEQITQAELPMSGRSQPLCNRHTDRWLVVGMHITREQTQLIRCTEEHWQTAIWAWLRLSRAVWETSFVWRLCAADKLFGE